MTGSKIGKRYAEAIYEIAEEKNKIKEVYDNLNRMMVLFKEDNEFKTFITHPLIDVAEKEKVLGSLFTKASKIEKDIVDYILEKNRIANIRDIVAEYLKIYYEKNQIIKVTAIFASEPSTEQKEKLKVKLEKKTGKQVDINVKIDSSIIGGGIIRMEGKTFDGSVRKELEDMKKFGNISKQGVQHN